MLYISKVYKIITSILLWGLNPVKFCEIFPFVMCLIQDQVFFADIFLLKLVAIDHCFLMTKIISSKTYKWLCYQVMMSSLMHGSNLWNNFVSSCPWKECLDRRECFDVPTVQIHLLHKTQSCLLDGEATSEVFKGQTWIPLNLQWKLSVIPVLVLYVHSFVEFKCHIADQWELILVSKDNGD